MTTERRIIARVKTSNRPELIGKEAIVSELTGRFNDIHGRSFYGDLRNIFPDYGEDAYCLEKKCAHIGGDWEIIEVELRPMDMQTTGLIMVNNGKLREENYRLKKQLTGLETEHSLLIDEYCEVMGDNRELKEELRQKEDDLEVFTKEADNRISRRDQIIADQNKVIGDLRKDNESLAYNVGELTTAVEEVIEERDDAWDSLHTVRENYVDLFAERNKYRDQNDLLATTIEEMYEDNGALQEIIQDQAQEIENLESLMESEDQMDTVVDLFEPYDDDDECDGDCENCSLNEINEELPESVKQFEALLNSFGMNVKFKKI